MKKIGFPLLLVLAGLSCPAMTALAYDTDEAGRILWRYYDGATPGGSMDVFAHNENPTGALKANAFATYTRFYARYGTTPPLNASPAGTDALQTSFLALPPEKRNISKSTIALKGDDQSNIKIPYGKQADVWMTFTVTPNSAGYQHSIGFFTYNPSTPLARNSDGTNTLHTEQIVLPPPTNQGAVTAYLGRFDGSTHPQGLGVGFFIVANGWKYNGRTLSNDSLHWGVDQNASKNAIFYSLRALNPESTRSDPFLNQHTLLIDDHTQTGSDGKSYERTVFAFEDSNRSLSTTDSDFNDVVLTVHASPVSTGDTIASFIDNLAPTAAGTPDAGQIATTPEASQWKWDLSSYTWRTLKSKILSPAVLAWLVLLTAIYFLARRSKRSPKARLRDPYSTVCPERASSRGKSCSACSYGDRSRGQSCLSRYYDL